MRLALLVRGRERKKKVNPLLCLDLKYLISCSLERQILVDQEHTYEQRGATESVSFMMLINEFVVTSIFSPGRHLDLRLQVAGRHNNRGSNFPNHPHFHTLNGTTSRPLKA
jgi:hypothetical protein